MTEVLSLRPHSKDAEECVIGGLLIDPDTYDAVSEIICADDFYFPIHRMLYEGIAKLVATGQPIDNITLAESLSDDDLMIVGGLGAILDMQDAVPTAKNTAHYAKIVRDEALMRSLVDVGREITSMGHSPQDDPQDVVDRAEALVCQITDTRTKVDGPVGMHDLLSGTMDKLDMLVEAGGGITGMTTGFRDLDDMTSGLQDGDLVIVAGRPSMGKTALMMNMAEAAALADEGPVVVFSLEMPRDQLMMRMLSGLARVDFSRMRSGSTNQDELARIAGAVKVLHNRPLHVDDDGSVTPAGIRSRCRRLARKHGKLSLIVIDYLQLMNSGNKSENRTNEVADISRSLKALAKEFSCPVVAGSQLNRGLEARADKRPLMSDLRESGAIEQDADVVMALYRDEVYHPGSPDKGVAEVLVLKQRNGPVGMQKLSFMGQYTRFEDYAPIERYSVYEEYQ